VLLCPLYGALSLQDQRKAILPAPAGQRKVVLATNIAETSLTIEGIRLVVDSAQERVASFDPRTGLTKLLTQRISQASMVQRAGRAGRLEPGICLHLTSAEQAERAAQQSTPEILQSDLSGLVMDLLQWGCPNPEQLTWLNPPPVVNLTAARTADPAWRAGRRASDGARPENGGAGQRSASGRDAGGRARDDEIATAAKLAAILEEPPRGGSSDLGQAFSRNQGTGSSGRSSCVNA
jgi:ATP-dependent helicase HrpB